MRSSSSKLDGAGDFSQAFPYEGGVVGLVYARRLLSLPSHPQRGPAQPHPERAPALPYAGEDGLPAVAAAAEALLGAAAGARGAASPGRQGGRCT